MAQHWDVIVIGGGAAGLMCAAEAAKGNKKVLVLEHQNTVGKKILISGGGRCNFTNMYASAEQYISQNPHFAKSALARYTPWDFIALVEEHGIAYYEKKLGQLFCRNSAKDIVDLLLSECQKGQVQISTGQSVHSVTFSEGLFSVKCAQENHTGQALVLASGGLSIPKIGASDLGYRILKQFEHKIIPTRPALVPLTFGDETQHLTQLKGVAVDSVLQVAQASFEERTLFTHFGLSGPAILQISSYWSKGESLTCNFLPGHDLQILLQEQSTNKAYLHNYLSQFLPKRMVQHWCEHYVSSKPLNQLNAQDISAISKAFHAWDILPVGTSGYKKAEVTLGGADTQGFEAKTMMSRHIPGLYCIGELMDVTGWLGGYNFQWAWASAVAAGKAMAST